MIIVKKEELVFTSNYFDIKTIGHVHPYVRIKKHHIHCVCAFTLQTWKNHTGFFKISSLHCTVLYTMQSAACNFLPWPATSMDCTSTSPSLPLNCSHDVCLSNSFTYATCRFQSSISLQYPLHSYSFLARILPIRTILLAVTVSSRNPQKLSLFAKQKRWFDS